MGVWLGDGEVGVELEDLYRELRLEHALPRRVIGGQPHEDLEKPGICFIQLDLRRGGKDGPYFIVGISTGSQLPFLPQNGYRMDEHEHERPARAISHRGFGDRPC